jgi:hypothetical protein
VAFDPFAFEEDGLTAPGVDVGRSEIVEALVIAVMVVVLDEGGDLAFEIAGQVCSTRSRPFPPEVGIIHTDSGAFAANSVDGVDAPS